MARRVTTKRFYLGLGALALLGVGAIWYARATGGAGPITVSGPVELGAAFEGYVLGADTAPVEVIEYADFQCPACASFAILHAPDFKAGLVNTGRVRWRFRDFPLPQHDRAPLAHHAAACAGEQGRFWEMHDQLFFNQGAWARDRRPERVVRELATAAGLDLGRYEECMESGRYAARVAATKAHGISLGVNSTPTFIIGERLFPGTMSAQEIATQVRRVESARPR